jgi:hypothetical protein
MSQERIGAEEQASTKHTVGGAINGIVYAIPIALGVWAMVAGLAILLFRKG